MTNKITAQHWISQLLVVVLLFTQSILLANEPAELIIPTPSSHSEQHAHIDQHHIDEYASITLNTLDSSVDRCNDTQNTCDNCHHCHGSHVSLVVSLIDILQIEPSAAYFLPPNTTINKIREGIDRPPIQSYL